MYVVYVVHTTGIGGDNDYMWDADQIQHIEETNQMASVFGVSKARYRKTMEVPSWYAFYVRECNGQKFEAWDTKYPTETQMNKINAKLAELRKQGVVNKWTQNPYGTLPDEKYYPDSEISALNNNVPEFNK
jgi:hypothetical protein